MGFVERLGICKPWHGRTPLCSTPRNLFHKLFNVIVYMGERDGKMHIPSNSYEGVATECFQRAQTT